MGKWVFNERVFRGAAATRDTAFCVGTAVSVCDGTVAHIFRVA